MYCSFKEVQDEFKTALNKGLFKNRSISLDKDFNIRHLAFLGAQAPAIKGLEEFCYQDFDSYEFTDFQDLKERTEKMENVSLTEQLKAKDEEILKLKKQIEESKRVQKLAEFEDFAKTAIKNGNILPKHKESIINILSVCDSAENFNFSDGTEKTALETVKEFITSLKTMNFEDIATKNEVSDLSNPQSIAKELEKIMKEQNVDLTTAFGKLHK